MFFFADLLFDLTHLETTVCVFFSELMWFLVYLTRNDEFFNDTKHMIFFDVMHLTCFVHFILSSLLIS